MNDTAKIGLWAVGGVFVVCVAGKHLLGDGRNAAYVKSLHDRPYTERNLAEEYGLDPNRRAEKRGPLSGMSNATYAVKLNNALEAEASRIRIEFEEEVGTAGTLFSLMSPGASIDAAQIARARFEDQGLIPPKE